MKKVRITKEMREEMEYYRVGLGKYTNEVDAFADFMYDLQTERLRVVIGETNVETDINKYNMMRAYITQEYEVEPEFKVGDWIAYDKDSGDVNVMQIIGENDSCFILDGGYGKKIKGIFPKYYRQATPLEISTEKTRRWWARHGRDVWELKKDDHLRHIDETECARVLEAKDGVVWLMGFDPIKEYELKELFVVAFFAEDKKDI